MKKIVILLFYFVLINISKSKDYELTPLNINFKGVACKVSIIETSFNNYY